MKKTYTKPQAQSLSLFAEDSVMETGSLKIDGDKSGSDMLSGKKEYAPSIWDTADETEE